MVNEQIFYNAIRKDIKIIRGDSLAFNFQLEGLGGKDPENITFTCKDQHDDEEVLFTCTDKNDGITREAYDEETDTLTYTVRVAPSKTATLDLSRYYYDLQITINGDVVTLLKGRLNLDYNVTKGV